MFSGKKRVVQEKSGPACSERHLVVAVLEVREERDRRLVSVQFVQEKRINTYRAVGAIHTASAAVVAWSVSIALNRLRERSNTLKNDKAESAEG